MSGKGEERYWLWLQNVPGIGAMRFYDILAQFVDAKTAFENPGDIAARVRGIGGKTAENLVRTANEDFIDALYEKLRRAGTKVLTRLDQNYPAPLAQIDNPPPVLYFRGSIPDYGEASCGMVGTRNPTKSGFITARDMAERLAASGVVIVSGMARGIDTAAHRGALMGNGKTIAVLGCGVDIAYPPENDKLMAQIMENGAVLSEYFVGVEPKPSSFPPRNRIIAGLSKVLLVGEGGRKSGARITVDYALDYGRDIYAMLCDMRSAVAKLPLYLINNGAPMVENAAEILADQGWAGDGLPEAKNGAHQSGPQNKLDFLEAQIYNLLLKGKHTTEELAEELGCPVKEVAPAITKMEIKGLIAPGPGDTFNVNS